MLTNREASRLWGKFDFLTFNCDSEPENEWRVKWTILKNLPQDTITVLSFVGLKARRNSIQLTKQLLETSVTMAIGMVIILSNYFEKYILEKALVGLRNLYGKGGQLSA